jgi:L-ascorbate metabolism protein UlaG (beta-lactamase superfamily)
MKIKWIGHACFLIEGETARILTDPYGEKIPYRPPDFTVDVITVSHEHFDHNAVERVKGTPVVLRGEGLHHASGISFHGIASFHDEEQGKKRGENTIFAFEVEDIHLAHLGDLGTPLTEDQARALADVEVLFIPVGGHFTIGPEEAKALTEGLPNLKVVIPMHYKTDRLDEGFPIAPVDKFASKMQNVAHIGSSEVVLTRDTLPAAQEVWIFDYA